MDSLKDAIRKGISFQKTLLEDMNTDQESIQQAHKRGINNVLPAFFAMDYDSLKSLSVEYFADKSEKGVFEANLFGEMLGNTGKSKEGVKFSLNSYQTKTNFSPKRERHGASIT